MPASPALGEDLAPSVVRPLVDWELQLLGALADLVKSHVENAEFSDARRLAELSAMVHRVRLEGRRISRELEQQIRAVLGAANTAGARAALDDFEALGLEIPESARPPLLPPSTAPRVISRAAVEAVPGLLSSVYSQAVAAGALETLRGQTRLAASQGVLDRLLGEGIRGFKDKAGRTWSLETYVEMAVRTTAGQTATEAHARQLQDLGHDLVLVSNAPRECPLCRPWEGKILSISGATPRGTHEAKSATDGSAVTVKVAGTLDEAKEAGLQHPNCRHTVGAYLPGATTSTPAKAEPEGYEAQQRQRVIERKIREWKRREQLAMIPEAKATSRGKVLEWQGAMRDHLARNPALKRQSQRERVGTPPKRLAR